MKKKKAVLLGVILAILIILAIFFKQIVNFIVNIEWFSEVGYLNVYLTQIKATLILFIPMFLLCYFLIYFYYRSIKKSILRWDNENNVKTVTIKHLSKVFVIMNLLISFFVSFGFANTYWYRILQFVNSTDFKVCDPIFNIDVSFYVFKLPLIESFYEVIISILIALIIITIIVYLILNTKDIAFSGTGNIFSRFKNLNYVKSGLTRFAGKQVAVSSFFIMLFISFGFILKCINLVYSKRGVVFGAGYTDVHVSLVFYIIIAVISFIAAFVVLINILKQKLKPIIISACIIIGLVIIQNIAYPTVERLVVKSNQQSLEEKYIKNNIKYTQKAFKLDNISTKSLEVKDDLTKDDVSANQDIIDNIKVNSYKQALEYYNQVEVIRNYYDFNDIDVDRYTINGKYNQVFLAPREINIDSLESSANIWQNRHLVYTHGYGVVMNKVNSVTSEGQPDFIMDDIPTKNNTDIKLDNPRIYFGEKTNDYAIVNTSLGEFDYPKGGNNQTTNYKGKAGIKMSLFNKFVYAAKNGDVNFFLSRYIKSDSKVLINRNIMDRVKKIAPFLNYDKDPYSVVNNGKVYWIIDAYTTSDKYPYSEPYKNGINYIRNSVKVVVDAYDGTTDFYIADKSDPIAVSYSKIFPGLFKDISSMPEGLKSHLRYPQDIYDIQASVFGKYHVTDTGVFFNGEDMWEVSENQTSVDNEENSKNEAAYVVMKLPGNDTNEMVLLEYFNMKKKQNMLGMLGARMDGDNYGKLTLYKFPTDKTIYSPQLFNQRIKQDTEISKELSLWNTQGSEVQFGDTVIVPINNSLLYVEPLYLRAKGKNSIPEMKRVIVSYGKKVILSDSVDNAFTQIFATNETTENQNTVKAEDSNTASGSSTPNDSSANVSTNGLSEEDLKKANDLYAKAVEAQKSGDWAKYGDYIKQLGDLLNKTSK